MGARSGDARSAQSRMAAALCRVARSTSVTGGGGCWRNGSGSQVNLPVPRSAHTERIDGRDLDSTWLATPVALEARLDHVRLLDRGPVASRRVRP